MRIVLKKDHIYCDQYCKPSKHGLVCPDHGLTEEVEIGDPDEYRGIWVCKKIIGTIIYQKPEEYFGIKINS